ncbi:MAG: LysE family transporter [Nitrospiraceae bacterium]|nr:LysE family transporter [Nitrospiraceae bacterium]
MELLFFLKGLVIGFVVAAPVGPIGILCARRTLVHGRRAGFFSGMGAATADAIYGFIAAFGLSVVSNFLAGHQLWFRLVGGSILVVMGVRAFNASPTKKQDLPRSARHYAGMYSSTFFLTLTNPMTIFSFAAVFAGFGLAGTRGSLVSAAVLILGVFLGSALWWLFLVGIFSIWRKRFAHHQLGWVNRIAGLIIGGSGVLALLSLVL